MNFINYLISINIIAFFLILIDKKKAIYHKWRISEDVLLLSSLVGGCFGMIIAMQIFHHKTKKLKFKLVYLFCLIWLLLFFNFKYMEIY